MNYEELLVKLQEEYALPFGVKTFAALRAVVELHKPYGEFCSVCAFELRTTVSGFPIEHLHTTPYPCPTIQAIEKELK